MSDDRFKAWLTFFQIILGTVVLGVFSAIINNQIQTREIEIKEQEAVAFPESCSCYHILLA